MTISFYAPMDRPQKRRIEETEGYIVGSNISENDSIECSLSPEVVLRTFGNWAQNPTDLDMSKKAFRILDHVCSNVPAQKKKRTEIDLQIKKLCIAECSEIVENLYNMLPTLKSQPELYAEIEGIVIQAEEILSREENHVESEEMEEESDEEMSVPGIFEGTLPLSYVVKQLSPQSLDQCMDSLSIVRETPDEEMSDEPHLDCISYAREIMERIYDRFGIPSGAINTGEEAIRFLSKTVKRVDIINEVLPEKLRSLSGIHLVRDIEQLEKFFEAAYDFSLVQAFGDLAGAIYDSWDNKVRHTRKWLETDACRPITTLTLSKKSLVLLPKEIGKFTSLKALDLRENSLFSLPPELWRLTKLENLILSNNKLSSLPPEVGNLLSLKRLWLDTNQLTSIPSEIGKLQDLRWLWIGFNRLNSIPSDIGKLTKLIVLYLSHNKISAVPQEIGKLRALISLALGSNQITCLPKEIGNLTELRILSLGFNKIEAFPSEICGTSLTIQGKSSATVEMSGPDESLSEGASGEVAELMSETICGLSSLQVLIMDFNELESLPPEIEKLRSLRTLRVDNNNLTSLPPGITKLQALQELNIEGNLLISVPEGFENLGSLQILNIRNNRRHFQRNEFAYLLPSSCHIDV